MDHECTLYIQGCLKIKLLSEIYRIRFIYLFQTLSMRLVFSSNRSQKKHYILHVMNINAVYSTLYTLSNIKKSTTHYLNKCQKTEIALTRPI